jgi:hypothetical protein
LHDDVVLPPSPGKKAGKETLRRAERNVIRVDEVGTTNIVARQEASIVTKPT